MLQMTSVKIPVPDIIVFFFFSWTCEGKTVKQNIDANLLPVLYYNVIQATMFVTFFIKKFKKEAWRMGKDV